MPIKPEVSTGPYDALLYVGAIVVFILGAMVLPGLFYYAVWAVVIFLVVMVFFYGGKRVHRRAMGRRLR